MIPYSLFLPILCRAAGGLTSQVSFVSKALSNPLQSREVPEQKYTIFKRIKEALFSLTTLLSPILFAFFYDIGLTVK